MRTQLLPSPPNPRSLVMRLRALCWMVLFSGVFLTGCAQHHIRSVVPTSGLAKITFQVNPVEAADSNSENPINCGQSVRLVWSAAGSLKTQIKANGQPLFDDLPPSGEKIVSPKQTTTYQLETSGPGGVVAEEQTVHVNTGVRTSLTALPAVVRYHRVGDKVIEPGTATLNWSAINADSVRIDPIGPVTGTGGQLPIAVVPVKTDFGPIEETRAYKITATNACGGLDLTTAIVQVAGSIDPEIVAETLPPRLPRSDPDEEPPSVKCTAEPTIVQAGETVHFHCDTGSPPKGWPVALTHRLDRGDILGHASDFSIDTSNWQPADYAVRTTADNGLTTTVTTHFTVSTAGPTSAGCDGLAIFFYPSPIDLSGIRSPETEFTAVVGKSLADVASAAIELGICRKSAPDCKTSVTSVLESASCTATTKTLLGNALWIWPIGVMTVRMSASIGDPAGLSRTFGSDDAQDVTGGGKWQWKGKVPDESNPTLKLQLCKFKPGGACDLQPKTITLNTTTGILMQGRIVLGWLEDLNHALGTLGAFGASALVVWGGIKRPFLRAKLSRRPRPSRKT